MRSLWSRIMIKFFCCVPTQDFWSFLLEKIVFFCNFNVRHIYIFNLVTASQCKMANSVEPDQTALKE